MIQNKDKITSKDLFLFILKTQAGVGVVTLPTALVKTTGHDGWISLFLTIIPSSLAIFLIVLLCKLFDNKSIYQINKFLFGKYIGWVLNSIYVLYCFMLTAFVFRIFYETVIVMIGLTGTPRIIIALFMFMPCLLVIKNGFLMTCNLNKIAIPAFTFIVVFCVFFEYRNMDIFNIMPVFEYDTKTILNGIGKTIFITLGIELIPAISLNVVDKENILKSCLIANLVNILLSEVVVISCILVFGENMLIHLIYPLFSLSKTYHSNILGRVDVFFISAWSLMALCTINNYLYVIFSAIKKEFNVKKENLLLIAIVSIIFMISRYPKGFNEIVVLSSKIDIFGLIIVSWLCITSLFTYLIKQLKKGEV